MERYTAPEIEIIVFDEQDVIDASGTTTPEVPLNPN